MVFLREDDTNYFVGIQSFLVNLLDKFVLVGFTELFDSFKYIFDVIK